MKLTSDEHRALTFIAALLCLSAAVRFLGLPEPLEPPEGGGLDLATHIETVEAAVAEREAAERPLEPGETIDPSTATAAELTRLPRVGPALADRIVADREANGRYRRLEDLGRVSGVGERTLELLAPHVSLRASPYGRPAAELPLDLNRATASELQTLPGVGPVLADRIVVYRDSVGRFGRIEELGSVKGVGPATLARLRDRVAVR
ncbi:MAG: helix-hairpin-helix domain-containing protein [Longimicrobiales bacterium]